MGSTAGGEPLKVAALVTEYRPGSHADVRTRPPPPSLLGCGGPWHTPPPLSRPALSGTPLLLPLSRRDRPSILPTNPQQHAAQPALALRYPPSRFVAPGGGGVQVLLTKFLKGFPLDEGFLAPKVQLVSDLD